MVISPWTMGLMGGGAVMFSALMSGQAQAAQAAAQAKQFEWAEFTRRMDTQIKNRQIAKQNAARWRNNNNIADAANQTRAEEEFWLRYNYDNETGIFSRQARQANDQLASTLAGRNINLKSQTSKQLLRQALQNNKEFLVNRRVSFGTSMLNAQRKQEHALAQRDFGYGEQVKFMPGDNFAPDSSSIMQNALLQGAVTGAMTGIMQYQTTQFQNTQSSFYTQRLGQNQ